MNILVADDERAILYGLKEFLSEQGYSVFSAEDGEQALEVYRNNVIDLLVLDVMMPKMTGFEVLNEIRKESNVPIIILSALEDELSQLKGFEFEADDYVTKPFSLPLLEKRINNLLKRHYAKRDIWKYRDARIDFTSYKAVLNGEEVDIKPKEIEILRFLLEHENQAMSRDQILENIWDINEEKAFDRVIDVYIKNLRKKLNLDCIVTVKNIGYKLSL